MIASEFFAQVNSLTIPNFIGVEDFADKANFLWNVLVLLICAVIVTTKQYFMQPLACYIPTNFQGINAAGYMSSLCWVDGTYPYNTSKPVPTRREDWLKMEPMKLNYYQWVPFVLGLQAIFYYLPRLMWQLFCHNRTGVDLQILVNSAHSAASQSGESRSTTVQHLVNTLEVMLFSRRDFRAGKLAHLRHRTPCLPGKRNGNVLIYCYLFIKVLYVAVGFGQLILMHYFLRMNENEDYTMFGWRILHDIAQGRTWEQTNIFPRIGICQQEFQHLGAKNQLFAQCVLPVNMLNEKIYIFLFFYIFLILCITTLSIPLWIFRMAFQSNRSHYIRRCLKIANCYDRDDKRERQLVNKFVSEFLRQDGNFLLRILSMNAGDMITVNIVSNLFTTFKEKYCGTDFRNTNVNLFPKNSLKITAPQPQNISALKNASPETNDYSCSV